MSKKTIPPKEYRILTMDASRIYLETHMASSVGTQELCIRDEKKSINENRFRGHLSRSIETEKIIQVAENHRKDFLHKDYKSYWKRTENPLLPVVINVSFEKPCRTFNAVFSEEGKRYIRFGYSVREEEWKDHLVFRTVDGDKLLIGVEVAEKPKEENEEDKTEPFIQHDIEKTYTAVIKDALPDDVKKYIKYDKETGQYVERSIKFPYYEEDGIKLTKDALRTLLYERGFDCDGVRFVRYKRSAGSSKNGQCLFIAKPLYDDLRRWTQCGLRKGDAEKDRVSYEAYAALTLSEMKWELPLCKENVLILRDRKETVKDQDVIAVEKTGDSLTVRRIVADIDNKIWDGEGLLDSSVFEQLASDNPHDDKHPDNRFETCGMVLLRNRFFKTCAFRAKLQKWFIDNGMMDVKELPADTFTLAKEISDIKLVVTESSIKYFKLAGFDDDKYPDEEVKSKEFKRIAAEYLNHIFKADKASVFGIVKTDKPTHFMNGNMVRTSYQLLSTLGLSEDEVKALYEPSISYLKNLKDHPAFMRYHLGIALKEAEDIEDAAENEDEEEYDDFSPDSASIKAMSFLLAYSDKFFDTEIFKRFHKSLTASYLNRMRRGRILVNGTYATLLGNGAEMLYALIGKDYLFERTKFLSKNEIYTKKFKPGVRLLCARSPHVTMGNIYVAENKCCEIYKKYFELSEEIVCVDAIDNNLQQRLNGCDYDSDMMLITDNSIMLSAAEGVYDNFPVPYCNVEPKPVKNGLDQIDIDIADNQIGKIVNLSLFLNAKYWDAVKNGDASAWETYYPQICRLAVLSGMEIDKAKRDFGVSAQAEIEELQKLASEKRPKWFAFVTGGKTKNAIDEKMDATMSYVYEITKDIPVKERHDTIHLSEIFGFPAAKDTSNAYRYADKIRKAVRQFQRKINGINAEMRKRHQLNNSDYRKQKQDAKDRCMDEVVSNMKNESVLLYLLKDFDGIGKDHKISSYKALLFAFTVLASKDWLSQAFAQIHEPIGYLVPDKVNDTIDIYGHKFRVETVPNNN